MFWAQEMVTEGSEVTEGGGISFQELPGRQCPWGNHVKETSPRGLGSSVGCVMSLWPSYLNFLSLRFLLYK